MLSLDALFFAASLLLPPCPTLIGSSAATWPKVGECCHFVGAHNTTDGLTSIMQRVESPRRLEYMSIGVMTAKDLDACFAQPGNS